MKFQLAAVLMALNTCRQVLASQQYVPPGNNLPCRNEIITVISTVLQTTQTTVLIKQTTLLPVTSTITQKDTTCITTTTTCKVRHATAFLSQVLPQAHTAAALENKTSQDTQLTELQQIASQSSLATTTIPPISSSRIVSASSNVVSKTIQLEITVINPTSPLTTTSTSTLALNPGTTLLTPAPQNPDISKNGFKYRPCPSKPGIVGYWPNWSRYSRPQNMVDKLDLSNLGILNYAFYNLNVDASLASFDSYADSVNLPLLATVRSNNPNLRTVLSIGGWSGSQSFSPVSADQNLRAKFATNVLNLLDSLQFDGVDIDYEYPGGGGPSCNPTSPNDAANFALLLSTLRDTLGADRIITIAASALTSRYTSNNVNYIPQYMKSLSFVNIMTYDYYGSWSPYSDFNSPLNSPGTGDPQQPTANGQKYSGKQLSIASSVADWVTAGAPKNQLLCGLAFYGRSWEVTPQPNQNGLYSLCKTAGQTESDPKPCKAIQGDPLDTNWCDPCGACGSSGIWMYYNLRGSSGPLKAGPSSPSPPWTRQYFDFAQSPTLFDGTSKFISYDDPESLEKKAAWASKEGLAGVMIWELSQDNAGELYKAVQNGWASS